MEGFEALPGAFHGCPCVVGLVRTPCTDGDGPLALCEAGEELVKRFVLPFRASSIRLVLSETRIDVLMCIHTRYSLEQL